MVDISFAGGESDGGSIQITSGGLDSPDLMNTTITDFPADEDPISVEEVDCLGHQFTLNNELYRWRKPVLYTVRVAVLPGSANDETLEKIWEQTRWKEKNANDLSDLVTTMVVKTPNKNAFASDYNIARHKGEYDEAIHGTTARTYRFEDGNMTAGMPSVSVDSEGKMKAKRYTFIFSELSIT